MHSSKIDILIIFPTFERLGVVKKTLPTVLGEVKNNPNSRLMIHDSSVTQGDEKREYLLSLKNENKFFSIFSDNMSVALTRNMCINLGIEMYNPKYVCVLEDDHGLKDGFIETTVSVMDKYNYKKAGNGLSYGLFSGCREHYYGKLETTDNVNFYPNRNQKNGMVGGVNNCCRIFTPEHWKKVLKGYDVDEYYISHYQTRGINIRNYEKGFTSMIINGGEKMFSVNAPGWSDSKKLKKMEI